jgi:large subunit ribosomal protein L1
VLLPHGLGKTVRVLVFAEGEDARAAQAAGADIIADDEVVNRILKENFLDFDATLAVPSMMPKVGRLGRILGTRGLMPNPKAGTVVQPEDLPRAVEELKAGRVEFRNDKTGNLHVPVGKASFDEARLLENAQAVIDAVNRVKPSAVKGTYIRKVVITSTMGPGVRLDLSTPTEA